MPLFDLDDQGKAVVAAKPKSKSKRKAKKKGPVELTPTQELIKRRRNQMIIHSAIYYHLHTNIISDHQWQAWAEELTQLQLDNPDDCMIGYYDEVFKDWNGSTGMHLPFTPAIHSKAEWLIEISEKIS